MQLLQETQDFPFKLWQRFENAQGSVPQVVFNNQIYSEITQHGMSFDCVVVAAGIGSRMKADRPKQYLDLCGHTLLEWTVCQLLQSPLLSRVVLVLHPEDIWFKQTLLEQNPAIKEKLTLVAGGKERVDSVYCGLQAVQSKWCLVHDAARPFVHIADIERLIYCAVCGCDAEQAVSKAQNVPSTPNATGTVATINSPRIGTQASCTSALQVQGAILATPETDTLKRKREETLNLADHSWPLILNTEDRSKIYRAQTPQMFKTQYLMQAIRTLQEQGKNITDEASVVDFVEQDSAVLVDGSSFNFKVTTPNDLLLAQALIQHMNMK